MGHITSRTDSAPHSRHPVLTPLAASVDTDAGAWMSTTARRATPVAREPEEPLARVDRPLRSVATGGDALTATHRPARRTVSTTIVLADGETLLRTALARLLPMEHEIRVVAEAADGARAVDVTLRERPDVLVIDLEMPGIDGLDAVAAILRRRPEQVVLMLARHPKPRTLRRALKLGVQGFVGKAADPDQIALAVRLLHEGRRWIDPEVSARALVEESPLTDRELYALHLTSEGYSVSDIATRLFLAEGTVRNYLSSAMRKTHARSRHEAARHARGKSWL